MACYADSDGTDSSPQTYLPTYDSSVPLIDYKNRFTNGKLIDVKSVGLRHDSIHVCFCVSKTWRWRCKRELQNFIIHLLLAFKVHLVILFLLIDHLGMRKSLIVTDSQLHSSLLKSNLGNYQSTLNQFSTITC